MKEEKTNVLVLGMIGIQPDQYDLSLVARQSTFPPPLRDFYRLKVLRMLSPNAIIYTLNQQPVSGIKEQDTHVYATINRRGAQSVARNWPNIKFKYVLLDYMRFPSTYMIQAYGKICSKHGFLDILYQKGLFTLETEIFIPHLKNQDSFCTDRKMWDIERIPSSSNPLAVATSFLQVHNAELLGGLKHENELALLDRDYPFTKVKRKSVE
jgi:hypothetical protein